MIFLSRALPDVYIFLSLHCMHIAGILSMDKILLVDYLAPCMLMATSLACMGHG